jgi:hypothetical protein
LMRRLSEGSNVLRRLHDRSAAHLLPRTCWPRVPFEVLDDGSVELHDPVLLTMWEARGHGADYSGSSACGGQRVKRRAESNNTSPFAPATGERRARSDLRGSW